MVRDEAREVAVEEHPRKALAQFGEDARGVDGAEHVADFADVEGREGDDAHTRPGLRTGHRRDVDVQGIHAGHE